MKKLIENMRRIAEGEVIDGPWNKKKDELKVPGMTVGDIVTNKQKQSDKQKGVAAEWEEFKQMSNEDRRVKIIQLIDRHQLAAHGSQLNDKEWEALEKLEFIIDSALVEMFPDE
jgi:hypothetical protein